MKKKKKPHLQQCSPPTTLSNRGKDLENLCMIDASWQKGYLMSRYGVQVQFRKDFETGRLTPKPVPSLPDFEGVLPPQGNQFIFDAKTVSTASFSLHNAFFKDRQLSHMMDRSGYGALCFLLLHFNERVLKKKTHVAVTYAFPVYKDHTFWQQFDREEVKSISRVHCEEYGVEVRWWKPPKCTVVRPNLLTMIESLIDLVYLRIDL